MKNKILIYKTIQSYSERTLFKLLKYNRYKHYNNNNKSNNNNNNHKLFHQQQKDKIC